ncbi:MULTISPECIES: hypothetical protein [Marinobacter]|jgi:hypothetical protein|uniref:Uncharacterized protein n=1 Tax=Marinobacter segnicrescens TaxID=430453 RepID=A0A1H9Z5L6_9GAMM|nr:MULTISPECIES: hypothetical protein [Marinobacter]UZD64539.1 hypothetical protein LJ360_13040 [Marinobacter sp. AN1]SES76760.1 hypothetical protein SAMN04487962_101483 [Marinobacter segnicrescens]
MSPSFFEIVQLSDGDYALKRVDDESAPLVKISFSQEARELMENRDMTVARAMIDAGIQAVSHINDAVDWEDADPEDFELHAHHTLH